METFRAANARSRLSSRTQASVSLSVGVCQVLCQQLEGAGTSALVNLFFRDLFSPVAYKGYFASDIAKLVRKFTWAEVGETLLGALNRTDTSHAVDTPLAVARAVGQREPQQALVALAVKLAVGLEDDKFDLSVPLEELWSQALSHSNDSIIYTLSRKFQQKSPRLLDRAIKLFLRYLEGDDISDDKKALFVAIISGRIEWLKKQIRVLEKPFSWAMPVAEFPESDQIEMFLRGPEATLNTTGIVSFENARVADQYASKYTGFGAHERKISASFDMEASGSNSDAFVKITKTRVWYDKNQEDLPELKRELDKLMNATVETLVKIISKRTWARQK
ncbi:hypothetical protein PR002_g23497 [Phytophthora rubi]|uniref:Uncharacterized protein n=2 Tax=Phytophthora TaxID=4783 RepID=A0A6A3IP95_9STRA|nr:hypothetical protein PR002_g23497 [Phytophthora rubi]